MYCRKCGSEVADGVKSCPNCGEMIADSEMQENSSGYGNGTSSTSYGNSSAAGWCPPDKDKTVAILLAFFLGGLGIHNFYLGESKKGILRLLTCWIGLGGILALIDFIKMLIGSYKVDPDAVI